MTRDVLDALRESEAEREIREEQERADQARYWARVWRAVMLSPRVEICEALLKGETVPIEKLDAGWVERFGRRER